MTSHSGLPLSDRFRTLVWLTALGSVSLGLYAALSWLPSLAAGVPEYCLAHLGLFCLMAAARHVLRNVPSSSGTPQLWVILLFAALFRLSLVQLEPSLSDDIYRYLWDGRVQAAGINPYRFAPQDLTLSPLRDALYHNINHREIPTIYPPVSQIYFWAMAVVAPGALGLKLGLCVVELATALALGRLLRRLGRSAGDLVLYAWNPLVVVETAASGHAEGLAALLLVLAAGQLQARRQAMAGGFLGAAVMAKIYPAFCAPAWIPSLGRRGLVAATAALIALAGLYWTGDLAPVIGLTTFAEHWNHNELGYRLLLALSPDRDFAKLVSAGLFVALACVLMLRTRAGDTFAVAESSLWLVFALLCLSPTVHPWYLTWMAPWLVLCPRLGPLLWTATGVLSYEILLGYRAAGVWEEKAWVVAAEYLPVCAGLLLDAAGVGRRPAETTSATLRTPT